MKKTKLPTITIIIITYNVERTIQSVLNTISMQDYPKNLIEILAVDGKSSDKTIPILEKSKLNIKIIQSPYPKDPEACRGVGLQHAKGEIICFIDSDNFMPHKKWLIKMVKPFEENKDIVGSMTLRFAYIKNDNYLNRYFALIGSADPVGLYLGKADKLSYVTDDWRLYGKVVKNYDDYFLTEYQSNKFPTLGSNGFLARKSTLRKGKADPEHYFHIDVPYDLSLLGYSTYAVVRDVIIHDTATDLLSFLRKRAKYMRLHYQDRKKDRRYKVFDPDRNEDIFRLGLFIILSLTFIQPTYVALKGFIKIHDKAWFVHPIFCFCIMIIYSLAVAERIVKR